MLIELAASLKILWEVAYFQAPLGLFFFETTKMDFMVW